MRIKKISLVLFLFSLSVSTVNKTIFKNFDFEKNDNQVNVEKKQTINSINEISDEDDSEYFDYVIENLDDIITETFDIFAYNGGYTFVEPFDENNELKEELNDGKYIDYQDTIIDFYFSLNNDVKDAFETICEDDEDVNNMLKCINSDFNISVSNLSCVKDIAVSLEFKNQLIAIRNITGTNLRNPFVTFPSIGNINLNAVNDDSEVGIYSAGVLDAGILDRMWTLSQVLAELGLTVEAIAIIKASYYTIINTIRLILPQVVKATLIILACVAITAVCLSYWNQISAVFEAIIDTFVSAAEAFVDQIYSVFDSIMDQADESYADKIITIDGIQYKTMYLTISRAKSMEYESGDKIYHKTYMVNPTDTYLYIDPRRIKKQEALQFLQRNNVHFNTYTYQRSNATQLMKDAFPNMSHFFDDINNNCKDDVYQYVVPHIHASLGYTIKQSGKVEFTGKMNPHSFYGLPKLIMPTC